MQSITQKFPASCEVWTHDPWFTRPVPCHWAIEATFYIRLYQIWLILKLHFENYVKISQPTSSHAAVNIETEKLKIQSKYSKVLSIFLNIPVYQSSADLSGRFRLKVKSRKTLISSLTKKSLWFKIRISAGKQAYFKYQVLYLSKSSFLSIQTYRPGWQEPKTSHETGMALAHCILCTFLGVVYHCFPQPLDVPTFVTRCLYIRNDAIDPSSGRWNCGRECCPVIFPKFRLPHKLMYLLRAAILRQETDGFTSPPKEGVLRTYFALKIRKFRPGLNLRTWVLKASTLLLDNRRPCLST